MKQQDLLAGHHPQVSGASQHHSRQHLDETGGDNKASASHEDNKCHHSKNRLIRLLKLLTEFPWRGGSRPLQRQDSTETSITTLNSSSSSSSSSIQSISSANIHHHHHHHHHLSQEPQGKLNGKLNRIKEDIGPGEDVDSGYAWIVLAVMFLINASTFGTARAYALIYEKVARQDEHSRSYAALPFTVMGASENMAGLLTSYLLTRTNSWRLTVFLGSCLITLAHLLAAFYESLLSQLLFMGLMCGMGLSFVSISFFQINNAYFVRFRSRAFGLSLAGAAFGTFYISPLCKYVLDHHETKLCYLVLGLVLLPNVPLSLLLKPKKSPKPIANISELVEKKVVAGNNKNKLLENITLVLKSPAFHLIWPCQLMFCWLNFVFGMIINDFGLDRGLDRSQGAQLINIWACGQLVGRLVVSSLVDLKFLSYRLFTVICFGSISITIWTLNNVQSELHQSLLISTLVFILSIFIANLYILFNGLVYHHMDKSLTAHSIGLSSFIGSFFLLPRAFIIGHYRDTTGSYDAMLSMFTYTALAAALVGLLLPPLFAKLNPWWDRRKRIKSKINWKLNNVLIGGANVQAVGIPTKPSNTLTHFYITRARI